MFFLMFRKGIIYCLIFVLAQMAYAEQEIVSIEFVKEQYSPGETVQMRLITEPLEKPLKPEQLALYVNNVKTPIAPFFTRYTENTYLLYFDLPLLMNGPTYFKVENILYRGSAGLQEYTVEKEMPISNESNFILSVIPAFVVLEKNQKEFQMQVENRQASILVNISAAQGIDHVYTTLQTLNQNGRRIFKFSVDRTILPADAAVTLEYDTKRYTIPVVQRQESRTPEGNQTQIGQGQSLLVFNAAKTEVRKTITPDIFLAGTLALKNEGNTSVENITLKFTGTIEQIASSDTTFIPSLQANETKDILLRINEQQNAEPGVYQGILQATAGTSEATFPLIIQVERGSDQQPINKTTGNLDLTDKGEPQDITLDWDKTLLKTTLPEEREYPIGLMLITLILLGIAIGFYLMKKKKTTKEESFDEYLKKIRK